MARSNEAWISLGPLKGQNSSDNPLTLGEGWATDTENIVLDPLSCLAAKRRGSTRLTLPPGSYNLARHVPLGSTEAQDELWTFASDEANRYFAWRKVGGGPWLVVEGFPSTFRVIRALSFNGKLFLAGSGVGNRLYLWDGTVVRKAGLLGSAAPTLSQGPAVAGLPSRARFYKVDWIYRHNNRVESRSELSAAGTGPNVAGFGVTVTRPAPVEHATHWRAWGSADGAIYFRLSGDLPLATLTFDDLVNPLAYAGEVGPEIGTYLPPPMPTRLLTDGHRLLMSGNGSYFDQPQPGETAPRTNRVWYTPVLGTLDQADDERIPFTSEQKNFLDIGDPPQGDVTELVGPMEGQVFAFSRNRPWRLIPTGDLVTPYLTYPVTSVFGCGDTPHTISPAAALGETETGQPAIYFADQATGLYRITGGEDVQFVSADIHSEVLRLRPRRVVGDIVFAWPEVKQTWWLVQLQEPVETWIYVFQWEAGHVEARTVQGGWTKWKLAEHGGAATMFVLHNRTPGDATPHAKARVPYLCASGVAYVFDRGAALDGDTSYSASLTCAPLLPAAAHQTFRVAPPTLITTPHLMTRLTVSAIRDFGTEERSADIWLAPEGHETAVVRTAEGLFAADVTAVQIKIADAVPNVALWQIFLATMPASRQEPR